MSAVMHPFPPKPAVDRSTGLTIADGDGGYLTLDLRCGELRWLADACRRLVDGSLPEGASAIKVRAVDKFYLLNAKQATCGDERITILNLFDPGERVALTRDVATMVAALIDDGVARCARQLS